MTTKDFILKIITTHKKELTKFGVRDIGLFGSYLFYKQTKNSDIDILIDFVPEEENFDNLMCVYDYLENLFKNEKVSIITKNGLSPYMGPHILKEVLYV